MISIVPQHTRTGQDPIAATAANTTTITQCSSPGIARPRAITSSCYLASTMPRKTTEVTIRPLASQPMSPAMSNRLPTKVDANIKAGTTDIITPPSSPRRLSNAAETEAKQAAPPSGAGMHLRLPDMFASLMSIRPPINPNYQKVKAEAEEWTTRTLNLTPLQALRNSKADFTFLVSWWAPSADAEAVRTMVDWQHWAFPWDDQFDEGHLKLDLPGAAAEVVNMTALLDDSHPALSLGQPGTDPIQYAFQQNWYRIRSRAGPALRHRYKMYLKHYMLGVLGQVGSRSRDPRSLSVDEYLAFRRGTIGVMPCLCLVEYAEGIELPQYVVDHPSVKACQQVAVDLVLLDNDILSYRKDLIEGEELNLINILRFSKGLTLQEAVDEMGRMITERYRIWYRALADMPSWGHKLDAEVLRYLDGCRRVALGSLIWSFHTGRYFKDAEGELVREEQKLWIPEELLAGIDGRPARIPSESLPEPVSS
ncbi:hypothetical protein MCOR27_011710 [Pyricularia oryzae]|uniref:Terpene synthase n=2 Tax=Pyricularia TaxID=48558 RepID=A0ABQ8NFH9_PYRGI|nr:hypothetical protein MCOR01_005402 [Pyricularia oryzae]KAI6296212.1 hypothetical protein MCOR33_007108 [Pyricularia grisea]KAH9427793.1 hypothetical protein MCOR02_012025 [Pyricularia oryzae]KAI6251654.1 hypothetical protein MCOR19_011707 [Pyricularia oryzae]KAI6264475.1 hypothetical protein MCOR27_011710 [Pyricularia oryzae]